MKKDESQITLKKAFFKATKSFIAITPMLLGVILLVGLLQTYVSTQMLQTLFFDNIFLDLSLGTLFGAVSSGNPITSYIISEELLQNGISLFALSAFILSWVTLGIIQLPAEMSVFGLKFTLFKNILTLLCTIVVAYLSVLTLGIL
jgi:uncharacterized membrane protein YraQ (UPF0718 family)